MTYRAGASPAHLLNPAVKFGWLAWATVAVFLFDSVLLPWAVCGAALALLWWAEVRPWRIPGIRFWVVLGAALLAAQIVLVREGKPVYGPITSDGLTAGVRAVGRLWAVIFLSFLFVRTTDPVSLAGALMQAGLPYRWGFALVTALRLAPLFRIEAHHVYRAQLVRGVGYDTGRLRRIWLVTRHLCLPLLVSALRTADSLALSMEGRAFGLHPRRTFLRPVRMSKVDWTAAAVLAASAAAGIWHAIAA